MIAKLRDELSPNYAASTVNKYLTIISVVYNLARTEWDINCINPVSKIRRMSEPEFNDERLSPETEMVLLLFCRICYNFRLCLNHCPLWKFF